MKLNCDSDGGISLKIWTFLRKLFPFATCMLIRIYLCLSHVLNIFNYMVSDTQKLVVSFLLSTF